MNFKVAHYPVPGGVLISKRHLQDLAFSVLGKAS